MKKPCLMHEDPRPIARVYIITSDENASWAVGSIGVTEIVAYAEAGGLGPEAYLAVYKGDSIIARMPARSVEIHYKEGE
jgi:hypothetical protein